MFSNGISSFICLYANSMNSIIPVISIIIVVIVSLFVVMFVIASIKSIMLSAIIPADRKSIFVVYFSPASFGRNFCAKSIVIVLTIISSWNIVLHPDKSTIIPDSVGPRLGAKPTTSPM